MKKNEIHIGGTYMAKVSDKIVPVRLDAENPHGGWDATNLVSNKKVRIKSAQRLRGEAKRGHAPVPAPGSDEAKDTAPAPDAASTPEPAATPADAASEKPADKTKAPKKAREPKAKKASGGMSGLDAAAKILEDAAPEALRCKAIAEAVISKGLWTSGGKTPWATLYSAMIREERDKGAKSRFKKTDRGLFAFNAKS